MAKSSARDQSEERYEAFIRISSEGIWRCELDKPISVKLSPGQQIKLMYKYGYMAEANVAMAKMYGYRSPKPLIGMRLDQLLVKSDPKNTAYLKAFIENNYRLSGVESHEVDKNGRDKYFRNSLVGMVEDGFVLRAWGTQQDITDLKQTEAVLQQQNTYLEALHETAVETSRGLKHHTQVLETILARAGKIADTENGYVYLLDAQPAQMVVKVATGIFTAHIGHPITKGEGLAGKVWKSGQPMVIEDYDSWQGRQKSFPKGLFRAVVGIPLWSGKRVIGVIALCHQQPGKVFDQAQVTALSRLADLASISLRNASLFQELEESEQRFRGMADTAPVFIWVADVDKNCTYFNKQWLDFTGRTLEEEYGYGWKASIHPDDLDHVLEVYNNSFDAREAYSLEYRLRRHDGAYRWILDNGAPRFSPEGEFQGYIGSCVDVHDMRRADELAMANTALRTQRAQLLALNKSKDEFISLASHQLRTPATGVKQYIGMLLEGYGGKLTKNQLQLLQTAYESNERQLNVIDDLLRVAHVDAGKVTLNKERTNLVRLVRDVMSEQRDSFDKRHQQIVLETSDKAIYANLDTSRIRMVLENLIDNASKYSPPQSDVLVRLNAQGKRVIIEVVDQGVGIAKKDIQKLFQKFSRVNNALSAMVGGTGIGLYWAKKIVDLHGGTIQISSRLHKGTTFTVQLPLA